MAADGPPPCIAAMAAAAETSAAAGAAGVSSAAAAADVAAADGGDETERTSDDRATQPIHPALSPHMLPGAGDSNPASRRRARRGDWPFRPEGDAGAAGLRQRRKGG